MNCVSQVSNQPRDFPSYIRSRITRSTKSLANESRYWVGQGLVARSILSTGHACFLVADVSCFQVLAVGALFLTLDGQLGLLWGVNQS